VGDITSQQAGVSRIAKATDHLLCAFVGKRVHGFDKWSQIVTKSDLKKSLKVLTAAAREARLWRAECQLPHAARSGVLGAGSGDMGSVTEQFQRRIAHDRNYVIAQPAELDLDQSRLRRLALISRILRAGRA
jgi:hypothetical protein